MNKIWAFIRRDARHLIVNVISLVVIVGITVVPSFYAWFNIAGSWDPYGNTKNLKVAVANTDKGYSSDLMPVTLNAGERVVSDLRASTTIGYTFTTEDEAIEGVRAGRYYAAIVIPEDFSRNMVTILSDHPKRPTVRFYQNEKANAIAQIVTDKASTAVQQDIDASFAKTVTTAGAGILEEMDAALTDEQVSSIAAKLATASDDSVAALTAASADMRSYGELLQATRSLIDDGTGTFDTSLSSTLDATGSLKTTARGLRSLDSALDGTTTLLNRAIERSAGSLGAVDTAIDHAFDVAGTQTGQLETALTTVNNDYVKTALAQLKTLSNELAGTDTLYRTYEESWHKGNVEIDSVYETRLTIQGLNAQVQQAITELTELSSQLDETVSALKQGTTDAQTARARLKQQVAAAKKGFSAVKLSYEQDVRGQLSRLAGQVEQAATDASDINASMAGTLAAVKQGARRAGSTLGTSREALLQAADRLDETAGKLTDLKDRLQAALRSGDIAQIKKILSADPDELAAFIATPATVERHAIFAIQNNGSAMAPFYTTLAIWIGGVVLAALVKATASERALAETGCSHTQAYLGRITLFVVVGLLQASLIAAGDLFFLGVQVTHPVLFFLACWVASITFVNIIFSLTASFGDVGKAVAVVLMVLQVAGSGGTFPQQMLPPIFQAIYPYLPFVQSENAMRAAMFGIYEGDFWFSLARLAAFILPALLLGLVLRRPVIRLNEWVEHKLESTKVM